MCADLPGVFTEVPKEKQAHKDGRRRGDRDTEEPGRSGIAQLRPEQVNLCALLGGLSVCLSCCYFRHTDCDSAKGECCNQG